ncbi:MAG TPA: flagellar hook basal-body protein [Phycisphaerales bacterium]|nr:flagellar hook basal-body protein [Phycisphaerales bacterium]
MTTPISQMATGLQALMNEYETVTHNLANSGTAGFKRRVNAFSAELERQQRLGEERSLLNGRIDAQGAIDFTQGVLTRTERPLDVALEGKGFIALDTPQGPLYTRNGALSINLLNQLVDSSGRLVSGQNGPIVIPNAVMESDIRIDADGTVRTEEMQMGRIRIVEFGDAVDELTPAGHGCFRAPEDLPPQEAADTRVRQGYKENSNVQMVHELTSLISLSRLYEANINVLRKNRENSATLLEVARTA